MPDKVSFTTPGVVLLCLYGTHVQEFVIVSTGVCTGVCHAAGKALHMPVKFETTQMYRAPAIYEHVSTGAWAAQVWLPTRQQYVSTTVHC